MNTARRMTLTALSVPVSMTLALQAQADDATLDFGVPAWPGITVKTEIASQLLGSLGYETQTQSLGMQVIYQGMQSGDVDLFLGAWLPAQKDLYRPRIEDGSLKRVANNVDGAQMTLAVPAYLYEQGITSFADLDAHRDAFDGEIHGFGAGSAASEILHNAIDEDVWGLGDWTLTDTSVVGMLSAARSAISREEPIVWVGWTPHWMNLELPMRYLEDPKDLFGANNGESEVLTLMRTGFAETHPNLEHFFTQFTFSAEQQSWMINEYGQEERDVEDVARDWINGHPERLQAMLEGVTDTDGQPAWPQVKKALAL